MPDDLVLMDCRMPVVDGYEATREIRRRERGRRRTPIVAMTAAALPSERQRSFDAGMDEHVAKPVRTRDLESVLDRFVAGTDGRAPAAASPHLIHEIRAAMGSGFGEVVREYLADADASLAALRDAVARGDAPVVGAIAHRLKGSSGVLAETGVVDLCQRIEDEPAAPAVANAELARELTRARAAAGRSRVRRMTARRRVLLADDHAVVRLGLRAMIDAQPDLHVAGEADTGTEAVARFLDLRPDIGVIDLLLPGLDGAEVCAAIRRAEPGARLLILSGSSGSEHIHRALKAGAMGYLLKDTPPPRLLAAIRDVLDGRRVVPPVVAEHLADRAYQSHLSPRERDVLVLLVEGLANKGIASRLGLTEATVKTHLTHVMQKLGVEDRTQAALAAVTRGIVPPP